MSLLGDNTNAGSTNDNANTNAAGTGASSGASSSTGSTSSTNATTTSGDWYYHDGIKGEGSRPDWFKGDKYKTVTDQAKAYSEIEKKLGSFKGAPESYDLSIAEHPEIKFSQEDPIIKDFLESAKKAGASQEYVSELLNFYAHALTINVPDTEAEMKKIGVNADQDLKILGQWASNILSPDEYGIFKNMLTTADAFKVFEKLRNAGTGAEIAPPNGSSQPQESKEDVLAMLNDPRYQTDEKFRSDMRERLSRVLAREGKK